MKAYSASGFNVTGTANKTALTIIAASTVRPRVSDVLVGFGTQTPANQAAVIRVARFTAAGTSAASPPTPTILDAADVAALATTGWQHSAEPTYASAQLIDIPLNQQATYRYLCSPGLEFVAPATAANGIGIALLSATATAVCNASGTWLE